MARQATISEIHQEPVRDKRTNLLDGWILYVKADADRSLISLAEGFRVCADMRIAQSYVRIYRLFKIDDKIALSDLSIDISIYFDDAIYQNDLSTINLEKSFQIYALKKDNDGNPGEKISKFLFISRTRTQENSNVYKWKFDNKNDYYGEFFICIDIFRAPTPFMISNLSANTNPTASGFSWKIRFGDIEIPINYSTIYLERYSVFFDSQNGAIHYKIDDIETRIDLPQKDVWKLPKTLVGNATLAVRVEDFRGSVNEDIEVIVKSILRDGEKIEIGRIKAHKDDEYFINLEPGTVALKFFLRIKGQGTLNHLMVRLRHVRLGGSSLVKASAIRMSPPARSQLQSAETLLWGGFSKAGIEKLHSLVRSPLVLETDRAQASIILAKWEIAQHNYAGALDRFATAMLSGFHFGNDAIFHFINALIHAEMLTEAEAVIVHFKKEYGYRPSPLTIANLLYAKICVACAQGNEDSIQSLHAQRLEKINLSFLKSNLATITYEDPEKPLNIHNIGMSKLLRHITDGPKVTVIMPAFNAESTIETSISSVLKQTWRNIELIIVDDCSTDQTFEIISSFSNRDPRVRIFRTLENSGAYVARNIGVKNSTGSLITVQDSDDWSHPQRIEKHVEDIISTSQPYNISHGVRVSEELFFQARSRNEARYNVINVSSLMFRKECLENIGGWDNVRFGADTELYLRLKRVFQAGERAIHKQTPLSLILFRETSLTQEGATGLRSIAYGARKEYKESYGHWHSAVTSTADLQIKDERTFPVPNICLPRRTPSLQGDILYISDASLQGDASESNLNMWSAGASEGFRQFFFHWPHIVNFSTPNNKEIRRAISDGLVRSIVSGESINCKYVLVHHPSVLENLPDRMPTIKAEFGIFIIGYPPHSLPDRNHPTYSLDKSIINFRLACGLEPVLAPASSDIRDIIMDLAKGVQLSIDLWPPLIDASVWARPVRKSTKSRIVLGRHDRNRVGRWPSLAEDILKIYPDDARFEVRILGDVKKAIDCIGYTPNNWLTYPLNFVGVRDFLFNLDIYVYFTDNGVPDVVDRTILEAMAVGIPVILPNRFRSTFGDAASYCEPGQVKELAVFICGSEEIYASKVERGRRFVMENCASSSFKKRLENIDRHNRNLFEALSN